MSMPRGRPHRRAATYQVFISHATEDKWIAVQLDRMLRDAGLATFRDDRDIAGGAKIPQELRDQIKGSREVLLLWTPQAMNSECVKLEIGMACAFNLRIVPVRYLTQAVS